VLLSLVDLAAEGALDALLVGQDDAAEFGWTRRDLRVVASAIRDRDTGDRAWVTYGTDELAARLLARAVMMARGATPRVQVVYSYPENVHAVPRYEGQALDLTVTSHITTAGCRRVTSDPDLLMFVHNFPDAQEEAPHQRPYDRRTLDAFFESLGRAAAAGTPRGLADLRYSNGADRILVGRLLEAPRAYGIRAYGGWNTASNALGLALAQALLATEDTGRAFTIVRLLDDWAYQAGVRQRLAAEVLPRFPGAAAQDVGPAYRACAGAARAWLRQEYVPPLEHCFGCRIAIDRVEFPWKRLFNVALDVRLS
jgi:hypothetical protein